MFLLTRTRMWVETKPQHKFFEENLPLRGLEKLKIIENFPQKKEKNFFSSIFKGKIWKIFGKFQKFGGENLEKIELKVIILREKLKILWKGEK